MVEMAVVAPILLTMIFGMIEFGWVFMVKENLTNATREACRLAVIKDSTESEVRARFEDAAKPTGIEFTTEMLIIDPATDVNNKVVTVTVDVPYSEASLIGVSLAGGLLNVVPATVGASCSMRQEGE